MGQIVGWERGTLTQLRPLPHLVAGYAHSLPFAAPHDVQHSRLALAINNNIVTYFCTSPDSRMLKCAFVSRPYRS